MKTMKKIATFLLAVCLVVPCFTMVSYAANGKIQFTDPSTKTGEVFEVTCAVKSDTNATIGSVKVSVKYDTTMLEYVSGDTSSATAGVVSYEGTGTSGALRFVMKFKALKEGTTKLTVDSATTNLASGDTLSCTQGTSTITIAKGTEVSNTTTTTPSADAVTVTVGDVEYQLSSDFDTASIPEGFTTATVEYEGADRTFAKQEASGLYLAYLVDADGNGKFFIYDAEDASFAPFEKIDISTTTAIVLLDDATSIVLPEEYASVNLTVNGHEYPAWQHVEDSVNYVLYAMNLNGEVSLYQYDSVEGTYQRMKMPTVEEEVEVDDSKLGKVKTFINDNFTYVLLIAGLVLLFFLILIIVIAVKLHNRNLELDDLYDEYGIDMDEEETPKSKKEVDEEPEFLEYLGDDSEEYEEEVEEQDDDYDDGINLDELQYDEQDDFDMEFEKKLEQSYVEEEKSEKTEKTMKNDDSLFEDLDFDFDMIDLDD